METVDELSAGRQIDELENYFASYRDLPREIILKFVIYCASVIGSRTRRWSWRRKRW